jgi:hypothetical protein
MAPSGGAIRRMTREDFDDDDVDVDSDDGDDGLQPQELLAIPEVAAGTPSEIDDAFKSTDASLLLEVYIIS